MLQTLAGISTKKAAALIANKEFSTLKRTFDALNDTSVPEAQRMTLLQNSFGVNSRSKVAKNESALAKRVFYALTTTNGKTKVGQENEV